MPSSTSSRVGAHPLLVEDLGCVPYEEALELQHVAVAERRAKKRPDTLFLLEHPRVVTLGRGSHEEHLRRSREDLEADGIEVHEVARGGDVTYHAPGQLVGYPIIDLDARGVRDVHRYLRAIEGALSRALRVLGVVPQRRDGYTGVFVDSRPGKLPHRKIASIGIGVRSWVTFHGFALNVDLDLRGFDDIVPCGLHDVEMTSIARERGAATPELGKQTRFAVASAFEALFDAES
jgi:lipoate-protein ligase B